MSFLISPHSGISVTVKGKSSSSIITSKISAEGYATLNSIESLNIKFKDNAAIGYDSGYTTIASDTDRLNIARSATQYFSIIYPTGTRTFTLPNASGTIALTSNLSSYLPLTGGTLTGALSGTSATFSSSAATSTVDIRVPVESPATGKVALSIGTSNGANDILRWFDGATQLGVIKNSGIVGIGVSPDGGNGVLDTVGFAGTITASVKRVASFYSTTAENADRPGIVLGYDTNGAGVIAARTQSAGQPLAFWTYNGSSWGERMRITSGGNVGIASNDPKERFEISGLNGNIRLYGRSGISENQISSNVYYNGTSWVRDNASGAVAITLDSTNGQLLFSTTSATSGFPAEKMRITSATTNSQITFTNSTTYSTSNTFDLTYRSSTISYGVQPIANIVFATVGDAASEMRFVTRADAANYDTRVKITSGGRVEMYNSVLANSPSEGATGEGLIAGRSFKIDATGSGQSAKMYVVSNTLSNTYGSGLTLQGANFAGDKAFGFNLNTSGGFETYIKNSGGSFVNAMTITQAANVGIGVTPFANTLSKSLDLVNGGGMFAASNNFYVVGNANYDNQWLYKATSGAAMINLNAGGDGTIAFINAASGTAGTYISTFSEKMRITSGGNILIGTTSNDARLTVEPSGSGYGEVINHTNATNQYFISFRYNTTTIGTITGNNTNTAYNTSSDYRLKHDLKDFNGIDIVSKLKAYDFAWNYDNSRMYGVVAHELQEILPYMVNGLKDGKEMQGVDYSKLTPILVKAIQELKAEIDSLKN